MTRGSNSPTTASRSATSCRPLRKPRDVIDAKSIYVHSTNGHRSRVLDEATQAFVDQTRLNVAPPVSAPPDEELICLVRFKPFPCRCPGHRDACRSCPRPGQTWAGGLTCRAAARSAFSLADSLTSNV